ncbi:hypothetical protein LTR56_001609 [Elasticomyces elasticus]|nr:hypothetical protein LTR56_001609 [Elasticomyces elasticus]KAK3667339.1 hypothetical protein LTR22_001855 [Elasticomyces elasticus]KAK4932581.1 hypothetical protein LTR49_001005 [Elasticomyces elasticus]KAK5769603.1 hypothetical protein LTS12_000053 [Elasticomyces elasticus]
MASHRQARAKTSNARLARTNNPQTLKQSKGDKKAAKRWRRKIGNAAKDQLAEIPVADGPNKERAVALANEVAQLRQLGRRLQLSSPHTSSDHEDEESEDPLHQLLSRMPQALHNFTIERLQPMFEDDLSNSDLAQRIHDVATSLETPFAPPQQRIPVQVGGVVSPPNYRATCTARTFLHQSFYQPFQSYAHDAQMLHIIATDTQNCSPITSRTRDKPSNQPQSQTNLDQSQTYEPRIPLRSTFNPPSVHFSLQEIRGETQTLRRQFEKKVESEEQTFEHGSSTVPTGEGWKDAVLISSDNALRKQPADTISISSGVTPSSPYKSSSPPSNDCGSAQTQVVDCGGEARLLQAAASILPQKKVRWGLPLTYVRIFVPDVEEAVTDEEELTEDELDELPDMEEELADEEEEFTDEEELTDEELHAALLAEVHIAEEDADDDDELLDKPPTLTLNANPHLQPTVPNWAVIDRIIAAEQQLNQPSSPDISQTHQRQTPQPSSASQDFGRGSQSKYSQEPSAVQDTLASSDSYYADLSQTPQPSSATQDNIHAQLSQKPRVPLRNQDALAIQDAPHADLSQTPQPSSATQDNIHAQLSQSPQVPSAAQDNTRAQLSPDPRKPSSSPEITLKRRLPSDSAMPSPFRWSYADQRNRHYQADRSESAQPSPVAPTNHGPTSLLPPLPLQSTSVQRGLIALTSGGREDGAPPQPPQSPPAKLNSGLSPRLSVRAMRERHRAGDDAVRQWIYDEFDRLVEMGDVLCDDGAHE